ncbi:DUF4097 family beta strand repeat-containing protein [Streptococcus sp. E17BB]|uniref:DUF4097 family beta strand repeat-containing protein n=1 Tax=Streptococcus sp. E17BB TaxID=3278714 RepID=UPI00359F12A4
MTKEMFLAQLATELSSLSEAQRQEILGYFEEYLSDLADNKEALAELGEPSLVAQELLAGLREQEILFQVPQEMSSSSGVPAVDRVSLSLLDLDIKLMTDAVEQITLKIPESLRSVIEVTEEAQHVSLRQTEPLQERFRFHGSFGHHFFSNEEIRLILPATNYQDIQLNSQLGDIRVEKMFSEHLSVTAQNGDVLLKSCQLGEASLSIKNGDLDLSQTSGKQLDVLLQNGDLAIDAGQFDQISVEAKNGDVSLQTSQLKNILATLTNGDLACETVRLERLIAKGQRGDFELHQVDFSKEIVVETQAGDVEMTLTINDKDDIYLDVETAFGEYKVDTLEGRVTGSNGRLELGDSAALRQIRAKSMFGDVEIRR